MGEAVALLQPVAEVQILGSAWKAGKRLSAMSGTAIMVMALLCSVVPPTEITNVWLYEGKILAGTMAVLGSAWVVYRRGRKLSLNDGESFRV